MKKIFNFLILLISINVVFAAYISSDLGTVVWDPTSNTVDMGSTHMSSEWKPFGSIHDACYDMEADWGGVATFQTCFSKFFTDIVGTYDEAIILHDIDSVSIDNNNVECRIGGTTDPILIVNDRVSDPSEGDNNVLSDYDDRKIECRIIDLAKTGTDQISFTYIVNTKFWFWDDTDDAYGLTKASKKNARSFKYNGVFNYRNTVPITQDTLIELSGSEDIEISLTDFNFEDDIDVIPSKLEIRFKDLGIDYGKFYLNDKNSELAYTTTYTLNSGDKIIFEPTDNFETLSYDTILTIAEGYKLFDSSDLFSTSKLKFKKIYEPYEFNNLDHIIFEFNEDEYVRENYQDLAQLRMYSETTNYLYISQDYCPTFHSVMDLSKNNFDHILDGPNFFELEIPENTFGEFNETITCIDRESTAQGIVTFNITSTDDEIILHDETVYLDEGETHIIILPIINPDKTEDIDITISDTLNQFITLDPFIYDEENNQYTVEYDAPTFILSDGEEPEPDSFTITNNKNNDIATVTIEFNDYITRPIANPFSFNALEDTRTRLVDETSGISLFALPENYNIPDSQLSKVLITQKPVKGSLYYNTNKLPLSGQSGPYTLQELTNLYYEPPKNKSGQNFEIFRYRISNTDNVVSSNTADVSINILPQNDPFNIISIDNNDYPLTSSISKVVDEDTTISIPIIISDIDDDIIEYSVSTNISNLLPNSEIKLIGSGNNKVIEIDLPQDLSDISFSLDIILFENLDNAGKIITNPTSYTINYPIRIVNVNDPSIAQNITIEEFVFSDIFLEKSMLNIIDVDTNDEIDFIKIVQLPRLGELYNSTIAEDNLIEEGDLVQINNIIYNSDIINKSSSGIMKYQIFDGTDYSRIYQVNFSLLESPFGPNSQPTYLGGIPVPNLQFGEWSCKPGYQPVENSISNGYACELIPNEPPVANFTIYPLFEGFAKKGTQIYFKSNSFDPDYDQIAYNWSFNENGTILESFTDFNGSVNGVNICTNGVCTVTLTVSDDEDSNSITKTFNYSEEELSEEEAEENNENYENVQLIEGKTYNSNQLASLGLSSGTTVVKGNQKITVDGVGKITKIEALQSNTAAPSTSGGDKFVVGDGYCSSTLGENTINSESDCKKGSGALGIILIISFISIIGILGFVAWKKGLFSKLSKSKQSLATPVSYDIPQYEETSNNPVPQKSSNLSSMVKQKIDQGYSEGEIKSYLVSQGYSESEIDDAMNS